MDKGKPDGLSEFETPTVPPAARATNLINLRRFKSPIVFGADRLSFIRIEILVDKLDKRELFLPEKIQETIEHDGYRFIRHKKLGPKHGFQDPKIQNLKSLWANAFQDTFTAFRVAGLANLPPMRDQPVREHNPLLFRQDRRQIGLDLDGIGLVRQSEAL